MITFVGSPSLLFLLLLLFFSLSLLLPQCEASHTYYVANNSNNSNNSNCTQALPCSLVHAVSLLEDNDVLIINNGVYTIDGIIISASNITIQGLSPLPIFECNSSFGFSFSFVNNLLLDNLIVQNCYQAFDIVSASTGSLTITNVQFYNNGISLKVEGGPNLNINNTHFVKSYSNSILYHGVSENDSQIVIENSSFNHTLISGLDENPKCGAIKAYFTNLNLIGSVFYNNTCNYSFSTCMFDYWDEVCINTTGGAVSLLNSSLSVISSTFELNTAYAGGAIATHYAPHIGVSQSVFKKNKANDSDTALDVGFTFGGGIYMGYFHDRDIPPPVIPIFIHGSQFFDCFANNGGGVYMGDAYQLDLRDSEFTGNIANVIGGAIGQDNMNWTPQQSNISNCKFIRNLSDGGGTITLCAIIKNSIFEANSMRARTGSATGTKKKELSNNGAAINCIGSSLIIDESVFINNTAQQGVIMAGIYYSIITNTQFLNNYATGFVGAVQLSDPYAQNNYDGVPDCLSAQFYNCSFIGNTAYTSSVLSSECVSLNVTNCLFLENQATSTVEEGMASPYVYLDFKPYTNWQYELSQECHLEYNKLFCGNISFEQTDTMLQFYLDNSNCSDIKGYTNNETCRIYTTAPLLDSSSNETKKKDNTVAIVVPIVVVVSVVAILLIAFFAFRRKKSKGGSPEELTELSECLIYDVAIGKEIGAGSFGKVYQGTWNGAKVAIKTLVNENYSELAREALLMKKLRHPNIVLFLGIYNDPKKNSKYMVTEFIEGGNLEDLLRNQPHLFTSNINKIRVSAEVAAGMQLLEKAGIVHRDLAARNILIDTSRHEFTAKVSDFGMSREISNDYYTAGKDTLFPIKWAAPEVIKFGKFSSKADVWAMGILLWEIVSFGEVPYSSMSNKESAEWVSKGNRLTIPEDAPKEIASIIKRCWAADPNDRPTFVEIYDELQVALDPEQKNKKIDDEKEDISRQSSRRNIEYSYADPSALEDTSSSSNMRSSVYTDSQKEDHGGITLKSAPILQSPYSFPKTSSSSSSPSSSPPPSPPNLPSPVSFQQPLLVPSPSPSSLSPQFPNTPIQPSFQHLSQLTNLLPSFNNVPKQEAVIYDTFNDINEMKEVDDDGNEIEKKNNAGEKDGLYESNVL